MPYPYDDFRVRATIWDLDDTLVCTRHRLHYIQCTKPDWMKFHEMMKEDTVIEPAKLVYQALYRLGVMPIICTARPEAVREPTKEFLQGNGLSYYSMFMRANGDNRSSVEVKAEMLNEIKRQQYNVLMAFEDHPEVVDMYRQRGITCWAADPINWTAGIGLGLSEAETNASRS